MRRLFLYTPSPLVEADADLVPIPDPEGGVFWHGAPGHAIRNIAHSGHVYPGNPEGKARGYMAPVKGRAYLTRDLGYALIYALGGDMVGQQIEPEVEKSLTKDDAEGGVVQVRPDPKKLVPDEDWLGEVVSNGLLAELEPKGMGKYSKKEHIELFQSLQKINYGLALRPIIEKMRNLYNRGSIGLFEYANWARFGKQIARVLLRSGTPKDVMDAAPNLSHDGPLPVVRAWVFDKVRDNPKLKKDGSNFLQVAKEIPVGGGTREAIHEFAASGTVNWEKDRATDFTGPFGAPTGAGDDSEPGYWQGATRKRVFHGLPDAPPDWPYSEYPYGQLHKALPPKEPPGRPPTPSDWKDGVSVYRDRGREPGRMWSPHGGIGPNDGKPPQEQPHPFWRRPYDQSVDGPHKPTMKREPFRGIHFDVGVPEGLRPLLDDLEEFMRGEEERLWRQRGS